MEDDLYKVVRKIRRDKQIKLDDLADNYLSPSSISRYERGLLDLDLDKINLILSRMNIKDTDIPELVKEMQQEELIRNYLFRSVESQVRHGVIPFAEFNKKLALINHPTAVDYLRGKRFYVKKNYKNALKYYHSVIQNIEDEHYPESNIVPSAFLDLSVIAYRNNDYSASLEYLDQGVSIFNHKGSRQYIKYSLYYNKALILEQLGLIAEAKEALEPAWKDRNLIDDIRTRIQVYQLKSTIYRHEKRYLEAFPLLSEAFDLANINDFADQSYYILVDIAKITYELERYEYSERCLKAALLLKDKLKNARTTTAHIELSKTYVVMGKLHLAKEQIHQAIKVAKKAKDMNKLIQSYIVSGDIFEKEKNQKEACSYYKKALELADKHNFEQYKPELYEHVFRCNNVKGGE
jgi:tetratricopeptide (TPR) repeat protein